MSAILMDRRSNRQGRHFFLASRQRLLMFGGGQIERIEFRFHFNVRCGF
jgi:hypothetical protein